jgi:hypothetical protein
MDPIHDSILQAIEEYNGLASRAQSLMKRADRLLCWALTLLWELSVDAERWELLRSTQSGAVATLTTLMGDEWVNERSVQMDEDIINDPELSARYHEMLSRLPVEGDGDTLDGDDMSLISESQSED